MRDIVLLRVKNPEQTQTLVERSLSILGSRGQTEGMTVDSWVHDAAGLVLLHLERKDHPDSRPLYGNKRMALAYTGYQSDDRTAKDICKTVVFTRGGIKVGPTTGIASYFLADANQNKLYAWSSHGGVESAFVTEGAECVAVSNRPLLSHLVGRQSRDPELSLSWGRRMLMAGSSVGADTPFEGTEQIRPRSVIVVGRHGVYHQPHPRQLPGPHFDDYSEEGRSLYKEATVRAARVIKRLGPPEFRLSGGKDSRYVSALVAHGKLRVDAVTYSPPKAGEGPLAGYLAKKLKFSHRTELRDVATPDRLVAVMSGNFARSDGLLNECRQLAFVPLNRPPGQPELEGQAHHARGGFYMRVRGQGADTLVAKLLGDREFFIDPLVREREQQLGSMIDAYSPRHPSALGYWVYNDHRMLRWMSAGYLGQSRDRPVLWPLMDDQVLEVVARLSPFDRLSEHTFFGAMEELSPGAASVPLFNDTWKIDRGGTEGTHYPRHYSKRHAPLELEFDAESDKLSAEKTHALVLPVFMDVLTSGRYAAELRECLRPGVREALMGGGKSIRTFAEAEGMKGLRINQVLWRVASVGLVLEGGWL